MNSVLYIASITQARGHPDARAYFTRKAAEPKTKREARRAHMRHLANRVIRVIAFRCGKRVWHAEFPNSRSD